MWREKVSQISKIREKRNRKLNLPTNENELSRFRKSVVEKFGEEILPQQYYEFLQTVNGIEFNGLKMYGIDQKFLDSEPINQVDCFLLPMKHGSQLKAKMSWFFWEIQI